MRDSPKHHRKEPRDMGELAEMSVGSGNEKDVPQTPSSTHPLTEPHDHHHDNHDCRHKLKHILERQSVHITVVVLILLDTLIVILELLIDVRVIKLCPDPPNVCVPPARATHNGTGHLNYTYPATHGTGHAGGALNVTSLYTGLVTTGAPDHHVIDAGDHGTGGHEGCHHVFVEVLHVVSILILCIFVVEIALKIYVDRLEFFKNGFHVLDAVVVLVSLGLDIASLVHPSAFTDAGGLLILLRLWRVTRIVNGIIISVEEEWEHKVNKLKHDHQLVERERDRLLKENALLHQTLTNHGIGIPTVPSEPGDENTCEFEWE
ncbi:voltage-gated hydrogen channel 1-like [Branchiostoma lanceolatum]|uniref:voltage-gated hydrogen channel 1-like n=1 Tax=Branchiostoma lanceolatum TaxID=7740 RepID=UPI003455546A